MKHVKEVLTSTAGIVSAACVIVGVIGVIVSAVGAAFVIGSYMDSIPDVHFSNASDKCVKVVSFDENEYTCDTIPEKFNTIWTK